MSTKRKQTAAELSKRMTSTTEDFAKFESASDESGSDNEAEPEMSAETRAALLKGFDDSDSDSSANEGDEGTQNKEDDRIIELSSIIPDINSALSTKKKSKSTESGIVYIGRIPHGFYEEEMKSYFTQFGTILDLRMSRSKKTGKSRHYGFIEFADREVAEIVAETMHNYLLAGHLLQVVLLTPEEIKKKGGKAEIFKGAGKKFKAVPWATIAKERLEAPRTEAKWQELQKRQDVTREKQKQKIRDAGIDYEYERPAAKKAKMVEPADKKESKKVKETTTAEKKRMEAISETKQDKTIPGTKKVKAAKIVKTGPAPKKLKAIPSQ